MANILIDPDTNLVSRQFAVVYTPNRRRNRFPENCVNTVATREEAIAQADLAANKHAAVLYGPSRSSEGFRLYYLVEWLDATD